MSSSEAKSEDKSTVETSNNEMKAENNATKGKCIGDLTETEANGEMDNTSGEVHAEAETGNAVGSGSVELIEKPIDSPENKKTEDQQAVVVEIESTEEDSTDQTPTKSIADHDATNSQNSPVGVDMNKDSETSEKDQPMPNNSSESSQKTEQEKSSAVQGGLPKWMVQDANAPPSPSPEVDGHKGQQQSSTLPPKARGRGRGRRPMAEKAALKDKNIHASLDESSASQRPRRSTRTRIDYANPDAVTVLAEVDDEEPSGNAKRQKGVRGTKLEQEKGSKRKTAGTSEDEVREEDDDDDLDYGSKIKKKRVGTASPGKRGRPAGSKSKTLTIVKPVGRPKRGINHHAKESEDEDGEVVYDDRVSEKEQSSDDEFEETKPAPNKVKAPAQAKPPAKKRGRPPGRRQGQQSSTDEGKHVKDDTDEVKIDEESNAKQQTVDVEA
ncbi:hypothetical protein GPALN_012755 [Globodera pallida]|nr:hypothetical protein GPALN_012755 [Globodera pallida]